MIDKHTNRFYESLQGRLTLWYSWLFSDWNSEKQSLIFGRLWVIFLYVVGIIFWAVLFNWGKTPLDYHDWQNINMPRLDVMQDALQYRLLPLHVSCGPCLHKLTDRFLVLPDVITTPQMFLLLFVNLTAFVFIDLLLHYTIGMLGLLYLQRKFKLSLMAYSVLFFLFNFNGFIEAHYSVGHSTWGGYFLFPWFFVLIFQLIEGSANWQWVAKLAFLSFYIILSGGEHHFAWMMLFLAALAVSNLQTFKWALVGILFSGFLSAIRLLPPVLAIHMYTTDKQFNFQSGYLGISGLLSALVTIHPPDYLVDGLPNFLGYWEFDYFVGVLGAVFIIYFGVIRWLQDQLENGRFSALIFPTAVLFLFSFGSIYKYTLFNLPVLASESVPTRMVSIPITLLMIIGAVYFQEFLRSKDSEAIRWLSGLALLFLVNDLVSHLLIWKINYVAPLMIQRSLDFSGNSILVRSDPVYAWTLWIGLTLTLLSALTLTLLVRREQKKERAVQ